MGTASLTLPQLEKRLTTLQNSTKFVDLCTTLLNQSKTILLNQPKTIEINSEELVNDLVEGLKWCLYDYTIQGCWEVGTYKDGDFFRRFNENILSSSTFKDIIQSELPEVSELVSFVSYNIATGLQNVKSKRADKTFLQLFQEYNDWKGSKETQSDLYDIFTQYHKSVVSPQLFNNTYLPLIEDAKDGLIVELQDLLNNTFLKSIGKAFNVKITLDDLKKRDPAQPSTRPGILKPIPMKDSMVKYSAIRSCLHTLSVSCEDKDTTIFFYLNRPEYAAALLRLGGMGRQ